MRVKFPTPSGVGEAIGDSRLARECHAITLRRSAESKRRLSPSETSLVHMNSKRGKIPPDEDVHMGDGEEVDKERIVATETQDHITPSEDPPKTNSKNGYEEQVNFFISSSFSSILLLYYQFSSIRFAGFSSEIFFFYICA
ncbi:hypothetical protein F511_37630 [Dorcoceras hygrometricum]|uniref:Uncharacterized protein n=1 Tax=Dorcoceras hygrometricum TaxID=472368 RepID=A0A2Z7C1V8_9LAMI|nr:hypothetical protein F511_37630 [Dorcoceras hygrometricum]